MSVVKEDRPLRKSVVSHMNLPKARARKEGPGEVIKRRGSPLRSDIRTPGSY
jgi:hypothetical protein